MVRKGVYRPGGVAVRAGHCRRHRLLHPGAVPPGSLKSAYLRPASESRVSYSKAGARAVSPGQPVLGRAACASRLSERRALGGAHAEGGERRAQGEGGARVRMRGAPRQGLLSGYCGWVSGAVGSVGFLARGIEAAGDSHLTGTLRAFTWSRSSRWTLSPPIRLPSGCGPNHLMVSPLTAFSRCPPLVQVRLASRPRQLPFHTTRPDGACIRTTVASLGPSGTKCREANEPTSNK